MDGAGHQQGHLPPTVLHAAAVLAALALPWAHCMVLGLPGELEEMLEQY